MFCNLADESNTQGSINVVLRTAIVCKFQGGKVPAVVRLWSRDSRKSKMLRGQAPSQGNTLCDQL